MTLFDERIPELVRRMKDGELSPVELAEEAIRRIEDVDTRVGSFLERNDALLQSAEQLLDKRNRGEALGALYGLPAGIKDNIAVKGMKLTCASRMLADYRPLDDAVVIERLRAEDALFVGKLNLDEFAMGSSTETSAFQKTRNPWNPETVPGGSSGGSAAAVAAREVVFALGTDSGGSVRQPASFTGIVGFKPTYGRIPRTGVVAFASSFDTVGVLAKTVDDAAYVYDQLHGYDERDTTSLPRDAEATFATLGQDVRGLRAAVPEEWLENIDPEVKARIEEALGVMEGLGIGVDVVRLPHLSYAEAAYTILASAEAASNLARFDGVRYGFRPEGIADIDELYTRARSAGFGWEVKRRLMLGTFALSAGRYEDFYLKAQKVRTRIREDLARVFADYDLIVGPTAPTPAFHFKERLDDPLKMYQNDRFTVPANLAGLPAISVPAGFSGSGLPIGLQIMGDATDDARVLQVAYAFQEATLHHVRRPAL
ncbi:MAG: Asp-tRNA(Asn)/Glu-tRNA(Gln) amidotransferase subunit GatA [Hydrogenibacillus sp.]|nr:Asp-tRNA(Asn)/Glu-tRNA(Gln) amidotransferase subunit GatA [Hydrogenibacillus sp.]